MRGGTDYNSDLIFHHLQSQKELFVLLKDCVHPFFGLNFALYVWVAATVSFIVYSKGSTSDLTAALK